MSKQFPVFIALGNVIEVALRLEMLDYYGMRRTGRMRKKFTMPHDRCVANFALGLGDSEVM